MTHSKVATILALVISIAVLNSCESEPSQDKVDPPTLMVQLDLSNGFNLLAKNCFTCHSPKGSHDARVAPPMVSVKQHYIDEATTLAGFTEDLVAYVENPTEENSRMKGAVKKFGLMPKMEFSETDLRDIAAYIYHTELEAPNWYEEHFKKERKRHRKGQQHGKANYTKMGSEMAMQTKAQLGSNLMAAINKSGAEGAVEFCHTRALPLTDSMAVALNAKIKRVSDRPRNPHNRANAEEMDYINQAKLQLAEREKVIPNLQEQAGKAIAYYPITTNAMCLKCHGEPEIEVNMATLDVINALYPDDEAMGYGENELRGIWVVEMEK